MPFLVAFEAVIFYLCGGIPKLLSAVLPKYNGHYFSVLTAFLLVCALSTSLSYIIYKFFSKISKNILINFLNFPSIYNNITINMLQG